ncbi:hypothetical protein CJJ09_001927 [Candidozyma auris]|nr:hypothetical protein CJJ09_001927 [[Candida] auris]
MSSLARAGNDEDASNLPNFAFNMPQHDSDDDDDEEDDHHATMPVEIEDSSDDDDDQQPQEMSRDRTLTGPPPTSRGRSSIGSRQSRGSHGSGRSRGSRHSDEIDIADVGKTSTHSSHTSGRKSSIKNIFRRQSLLDGDDGPRGPTRSLAKFSIWVEAV